MKTKLLLPLLFLALFTFKANAQEVGDIRVGGGLVYGTAIEELGINIRGDYQFAELIKGGADFTFFFAPENFSFNTLNLNGFYMFDVEGFNPYALAGLNFSFYSANFQSTTIGGITIGGGSVTDTAVGLNLGGGADFPLSENLAGFGEVKYVISNYDGLAITAGIKFLFGN